MSSITSRISQTLTQKFAVTQADNGGAYFFSQGDIDTWYNVNKTKIQKVGSLYLINGKADGSKFVDVLTGENELEYNELNKITDRKTIQDMGREVVIGTNAEPRLLVLRRVQEYGLSITGGKSDASRTGFVVIENNCSDLQNNWGRFTVRVARV